MVVSFALSTFFCALPSVDSSGTESLESFGSFRRVAEVENVDVRVEEAGPEYADAVTWCLHNVPESGTEERWREDMFAGVVEKLKYCYDQLVGV